MYAIILLSEFLWENRASGVSVWLGVDYSFVAHSNTYKDGKTKSPPKTPQSKSV